MASWRLKSLSTDVVPRAAAAMARAFERDEHTVGLLPPDRTPERLEALLQAAAREAIDAGPHAVGAIEDGTGAVLGVALWYAPNTSPSRLSVARNVPSYARAFGSRLPYGLRTSWSEERHRPKMPHWYLAWLGSAPEAQGSGVGRALVEYGLERADTEGVGAYVESSSRANVAYYGKFGFVEMGPVPSPGTIPTIAMWRPVTRGTTAPGTAGS